MIIARATITIVAEDDDAVDEVYRAIHPFDDGYPNRVVQITETSREVEPMSDLHTNIRLLTELVNDLDDQVRNNGVENLEPDLIAYAMLEEARRNLAVIAGDLEKKLAEIMPKSIIAEGVTFERRKRKNRSAWDKDDLLRAVLDTRLFNPNTGEQVDPHDIDKVLHVWNLGTPRLTALRERNLDPDEFCSSEDAGWQIQVTQ